MVRIREIIGQNPWWKYGKGFINYDQNIQKARPIFFKRKEIEFQTGGIYILRGPRQVGKTTYLKDTVRRLIERGIPPQHILYLSLDFFTSRREMRNAINRFLDLTKEASRIYLLLDEVTSVEDWNAELKYMADQGISQRGVIVATGSSGVRLKEKGELLPGRGVEGNEYYIKPLPFRRFVLQSMDWIASYLEDKKLREGIRRLGDVLEKCSIDLSNTLKDIEKESQRIIPFKEELWYFFQIYLLTGGLPGVINHYFSNKIKGEEGIAEEVGEIFIRDVLGDLSRLQRQEAIARQLLKAVVERYGSRYTFSRLSSKLERSHITLIDYSEFLKESFISFILYAYDFNRKEPKWKGDKKVYFFDPFIFHCVKSYLTGERLWDIITRTEENEELQGKVVEGVVISHLMIHREIPLLKNGRTFLWFYYDKSGKELDAVLKRNGKYLGIEVKFRTEIGKRIGRVPQIGEYILLSREDIGREGDVMVLPVDIFLSLLPPSERNI